MTAKEAREKTNELNSIPSEYQLIQKIIEENLKEGRVQYYSDLSEETLKKLEEDGFIVESVMDWIDNYEYIEISW